MSPTTQRIIAIMTIIISTMVALVSAALPSFYTMPYTGTSVVFPRGCMKLLSIDVQYNYGYDITASSPIDILVYDDSGRALLEMYISESGNPSTTGFWNTTAGISSMTVAPMAAFSNVNTYSGTVLQTDMGKSILIVIDNSNLQTASTGGATVSWTITREYKYIEQEFQVWAITVIVVGGVTCCGLVGLYIFFRRNRIPSASDRRSNEMTSNPFYSNN